MFHKILNGCLLLIVTFVISWFSLCRMKAPLDAPARNVPKVMPKYCKLFNYVAIFVVNVFSRGLVWLLQFVKGLLQSVAS
jgi:hypothetical protein